MADARFPEACESNTFVGRAEGEECAAFTFDTESRALEAVCSSFVPSFVLFRMF